MSVNFDWSKTFCSSKLNHGMLLKTHRPVLSLLFRFMKNRKPINTAICLQLMCQRRSYRTRQEVKRDCTVIFCRCYIKFESLLFILPSYDMQMEPVSLISNCPIERDKGCVAKSFRITFWYAYITYYIRGIKLSLRIDEFDIQRTVHRDILPQ